MYFKLFADMNSPDSQAERATGDFWDVLQLLVLRVPVGEGGEGGGEGGPAHWDQDGQVSLSLH